MKKNFAVILFISLLSFFGGNTITNAAQYDSSSKASYSTLIPTAELRTPLVEEKDLNSCIKGLASQAGSVLSGDTSLSDVSNPCSLDSLARIAARGVVTTEFQSMMNMVKGGFYGDTAFLTNPDSYYKDVNSEITQNFLKGFDTNKPNMLDSVKNVKSRILQEQYTPYQNVLDQGADFPGGQSGLEAFQNNWDSCPTGNGWDCYKALAETKNDPFLTEYAVSDELAKAQKEGLQQATNEVTAGGGYFNLKSGEGCTPDPSDPTKEYNKWVGCSAYTPGSTIQQQVDQYLSSSFNELTQAKELDDSVIAVSGGLFNSISTWLNDQNLLNIPQSNNDWLKSF
ncbi:MAG: hypothetical protein NT098_05880 [Candidatus Parcubacteria bacterium]|nr:hypothetical protein [Candidatus Parcubacteria bacterium]